MRASHARITRSAQHHTSRHATVLGYGSWRCSNKLWLRHRSNENTVYTTIFALYTVRYSYFLNELSLASAWPTALLSPRGLRIELTSFRYWTTSSSSSTCTKNEKGKENLYHRKRENFEKIFLSPFGGECKARRVME